MHGATQCATFRARRLSLRRPRAWRLGSARTVACVSAPSSAECVPSCGQMAHSPATHGRRPHAPCMACVCSRACGHQSAVRVCPREGLPGACAHARVAAGLRQRVPTGGAAGRVGTVSATSRGPARRLRCCCIVSRSRAPCPTTSPARTVRVLDHGRPSACDGCVTVGRGRSSEILLK